MKVFFHENSQELSYIVVNWRRSRDNELLMYKGGIISLITVIALIGVFWWLYSGKSAQISLHSQLQSVSDRALEDFQLANQPLRLEVVNSPASITQGLSGREQVVADGMVFVMPSDMSQRLPTFWMKDMLFNLDFVWVNDGVVVALTPNVASPSAEVRDQDLPVISPDHLADLVIELPVGTIESYRIQVGDQLKLVDSGQNQ